MSIPLQKATATSTAETAQPTYMGLQVLFECLQLVNKCLFRTIAGILALQERDEGGEDL